MTHGTTLSIEALLEALAKELTPCSIQVTHHRRGLYRGGHLTRLLFALKTVLPPGSLLYLEYIGEPQTRRMLERGSRVEETPLGKALSESGFGSLENLYYPEGYREGHPKIRAQA